MHNNHPRNVDQFLIKYKVFIEANNVLKKVFTLPFSIPVYGNGVAILPLLMGITLFLTMRMSSATMDKNQKPVMYIMNGFFILLFGLFLSLYRTKR